MNMWKKKVDVELQQAEEEGNPQPAHRCEGLMFGVKGRITHGSFHSDDSQTRPRSS